MTRENQAGSWGRKTKPTLGASVNTPRHCGEVFFNYLRQWIRRQTENFFVPRPYAHGEIA
jgi:hypothetical protein